MEEGRQVFAELAARVSRPGLFYQILEYQETRLQLKAFQLEKLLPERAVCTYDRVLAKYPLPRTGTARRPASGRAPTPGTSPRSGSSRGSWPSTATSSATARASR